MKTTNVLAWAGESGDFSTGFAGALQAAPALPSAFQSLPHMPRPAKAFAFAMTSHSAKSKHTLCFFHGQILTPNCQGWPLLNPNGKPPFPRK